MLTRADTGASSNSTYTYDYENRLVRADRNASGNTTTSYYYYDPFGRRIVKTVYESSGNSRVAWYVYDREDILIENRYDARPGYSNGLFLNIHGPNIDEPVAYTNNGQMYFYHADGLGSIKMITDGTGNITRRYSYDAYGNITASIIDRPYTYTGREYDDETGLYYYRARYYDPKIVRFISKDPIGFGGGDVNLYGYVRQNPVTLIDPSGLLSFFWHGLITYAAAQDSGYGIIDSAIAAGQAMWVDVGSQGTSPADTVQHAMAGEISPNIWQSPSQALAATNAYIQSSINSGNLPGAIHAAQDLATPGHTGERWRGFKLNWETAKHILGDMFPSGNTILDAFDNTKSVLGRARRNGNGCP